MKQGRIIAIGASFIALLAGAIITQLPVPVAWQGSAAAFHLPLAGYTIMACLHVGAAVFFLATLGVYKAQLRRAYMAIAAGIVVIAIGTLQVSIIGAFNAWHSAWVSRGGLILPFLFSSMILYLGTRYFARIVGVKSVLSRAMLIVPVAMLVSIAATFLPHVTSTIPEIGFAIGNGITVWSGLLILAAAMLVLRVKQHIGVHYTQAMVALSLPFFTSFTILAIQFIHTLTSTSTTDLISSLITIMAIVSGILWLRAGYAFAQTKEY